MTKCWYETFDPLLSESEAQTMVSLCERVGSYGMYSEEPTFDGIGQGYGCNWLPAGQHCAGDDQSPTDRRCARVHRERGSACLPSR